MLLYETLGYLFECSLFYFNQELKKYEHCIKKFLTDFIFVGAGVLRRNIFTQILSTCLNVKLFGLSICVFDC